METDGERLLIARRRRGLAVGKRSEINVVTYGRTARRWQSPCSVAITKQPTSARRLANTEKGHSVRSEADGAELDDTPSSAI